MDFLYKIIFIWFFINLNDFLLKINCGEYDDDYDYPTISLSDEIGLEFENLNNISSDDEYVYEQDYEDTLPSFSYINSSKEGPSNWGKITKECSGEHQSPINIGDDVIIADPAIKLSITKWNKKPHNTVLKNIGHTIKITYFYIDMQSPILSANFLPSKYKFKEIHVRSSPTLYGSEHSFNNLREAMEFQLIFYNINYKYGESFEKSDGIVIISIFGYIRHNPTRFDRYELNFFDLIRQNSISFLDERESFSFEELFGPLNFDYYTYDGSFSYPKCYESVKWIITKRFIAITIEDIGHIIQLIGFSNNGFMFPNIRTQQPLNKRTITLHQFNESLKDFAP